MRKIYCFYSMFLSALITALAVPAQTTPSTPVSVAATPPASSLKRAKPRPSYGQDVVLTVTSDYCDVARPYTFTMPTQVGSQVFSPPPSDPEGPTSPISFKTTGLTFSDNGDPLLVNPSDDSDLLSDGSDTMRLLVRTVQPPPSPDQWVGNACVHPHQGNRGKLETTIASADPMALANSAYYLINIVRWKVVGHVRTIDSDHWYLFNRTDGSAAHRHFPFTFHPITSGDLRIYGNASHPEKTAVLFLAIHLAPQLSSRKDYPDEFFKGLSIEYKLHADKLQPINQQDLAALVNLVTGVTLAPPSPNYVAVRESPNFQGRYAAAILTNLSELPAQLASTLTATTTSTAPGVEDAPSYGTQTSSHNTTSAAQPSKSKGGEAKPITATQIVHDEGLYYWDISIAVPTPGYKETVFDSNNTVQPKSITRTNAYAMLDFAPWKADFLTPTAFSLPHLMTGLPISGKVFNKPFVGGLGEDLGLKKFFPVSIRVFGGVVYNKEFRGAAKTPHRVWKGQWGIELSILDFAKAVSKK